MSILKNIPFNTKHQLLILLFLAFSLNINTLFNEYAVDDPVVLTGNTSVQKGIKGIPEILTTEFFYGLEKKESGLSGGRYRPVALVIFALEYQFFGINPMISHLINILLFILLVALLYRLLQSYVFREQHQYLAFITCLVFIVHPVHTEVIANVKSRDELIVFILLIFSSFAFIRYDEKRALWLLVTCLASFFLALLTRESAVPFIVIVPLVAYFFFNQSLKKSLLYSIPLLAVFIGYMAIRIAIVGFSNSGSSDIGNAPFLYASPSEAFATKVFILSKYIWLQVFPHPLSCDYGYNQLKYVDLNSLPFILSAFFLTGLIAYAIFSFKRKSIFSFCILYFFSAIFLFSNFVIDIGAPLAERLLFQPSLAFCITLATIYLKVSNKFNVFATSILIAVLLLFSIKTILRNSEWKNDFTLYTKDVNTVPQSIRANQHAAHMLIEKALTETNKELKNQYFKKAIFYDERVLKIYPHQPLIYIDLGTAYLGLPDYFNAADYFLKCYHAEPDNPETKRKIDTLSGILYDEGNKNYKSGKFDESIKCYIKAIELNENNVEAWYNLGGVYFKLNDTKNGIEAWQIVQRLSPNHSFHKDEFIRN